MYDKIKNFNGNATLIKFIIIYENRNKYPFYVIYSVSIIKITEYEIR